EPPGQAANDDGRNPAYPGVFHASLPDYRVTAIRVYTVCVLSTEEMYGISNRTRRVRRGCRASQTRDTGSPKERTRLA
ncbi:MAG TPA: hypothetical protein VNW89_05035, partial [Stellaceae bacterium]|nr:hypothetical protein [Stellaceae bacterium]